MGLIAPRAEHGIDAGKVLCPRKCLPGGPVDGGKGLSQLNRINLAEREGFEPPIPFRVCRFSRPVPSTARPPLRVRVVNSLSALANHRSE
jgi:hypothetical protein